MKDYGIGDTQWASIWGSIFLFNILFNLIFGIVGDHIGWGRTIVWFGGVGCAVSVLLFFYAPVICNNFWFILACGALWCIMLAGYVPLSALVPSLVDKDKGAARVGAESGSRTGGLRRPADRGAVPECDRLCRYRLVHGGTLYFECRDDLLHRAAQSVAGEAFRMENRTAVRNGVLFVFEGLRLLTLWERA